MRIGGKTRAAILALASTAALAAGASAPVAAQQVAPSPSETVQVGTGQGRLIQLRAPMADIFIANDTIADVQVRSPTSLYVFGKTQGETTMYATGRNGRTVYAARIRVGNNINSIQAMLNLAMPDAQITATPMNGLILLTGTIATPNDGAEAERLVQAFVGQGTQVLSRLRTATPLQVNLQVRFAEVSRNFVKDIGANLQTRDTTSGFQFGVVAGRQVGTIGSVDTSTLPQLDASARFGFPAGTITLPYDPRRGDFVYPGTGTAFNFANLRSAAHTSLGLAGRLLGLDVLGAIDLGERIGQVTTLATPNLSALSGETGTFLAGGEIPIPISQGLGAVSVEYKQYGVSLSFTPTVMSDGRISLRVRPEVSQLSSAGAVQINGTTIPALTTRRAETTLELGSGQSMVIAGLLSNSHDNSVSRAPGLGDVPILGALFRSNSFQRNETELIIVITPYLVRPVNASEIRMPTDGYQAPSDLERVLLGRIVGGNSGRPGTERPVPTMAPPAGAVPAIGAVAPAGPGEPAPAAPPPQPIAPAPRPAPVPTRPSRGNRGGNAAASPGFTIGNP